MDANLGRAAGRVAELVEEEKNLALLEVLTRESAPELVAGLARNSGVDITLDNESFLFSDTSRSGEAGVTNTRS